MLNLIDTIEISESLIDEMLSSIITDARRDLDEAQYPYSRSRARQTIRQNALYINAWSLASDETKEQIVRQLQQRIERALKNALHNSVIDVIADQVL